MKAHYYDPLFYISSDKMPFTIRIEVSLKDVIDGQILSCAVNQAIKRYPYFSVQVKEDTGELLALPNNRPIVVYKGKDIYPLGSKEVNYHLFALSYHENTINFLTSHVITDGAGFMPFVKTVLYYYLCEKENVNLNSDGILLADSPFFDDELGNPYPEEKMKTATPLYEKKQGDFFRLTDGGYVNDDKKTTYRFRIRQSEMMDFNHDNDGSPCSLVSSLMAKAIWDVHPKLTKDIDSAISFNLRPGLQNKHNYRMLCSSLILSYPNRLRTAEAAKLCTCSRGMISLQSQPENVLFYAEQRRKRFELLKNIPDLQSKKELFGKKALEDSVNNTFSVSYVGRLNLGSIEPYIDSIYNFTDGSTYKTVFIEIATISGWFYISFLQGFSSDIYYRSFLKQLEINGLHYIEDTAVPLDVPDMILP